MSFIAWLWPTKSRFHAVAVKSGRTRRLRSPWLLVFCLSFLTVLSPAEAPESQNTPAEAGRVPQATTSLLKPRSRPPTNHKFEEKPGRIDYFKLELLQSQASENREQRRKRLAIPGVALASDAVLDPANANQTGEMDSAPVAHARVYQGIDRGLIAMVMVTVAGLLVARKLVPEFGEWFNATLNPWTMAHNVDFQTSLIKLEEEKTFAEFQTRFRVATPGPGSDALPARFDSREFENELFDSARRQVERIQALVKEARLSTVDAAQRKILRVAYEKLQLLKTQVANPESQTLEQMTCAMELFIKDLTEKAGTITSSTLRTATQGMEVLAELCCPEIKRDLLTATPLRFLVVDDEMFSRYALSMALKRTLTAPEIVESSESALKLVTKNTYDLIFLDISMPGMDGFELCVKIHETEQNRLTPVVFVSALRDFDTRAKSIVSGARDIISKPFLTFELTVKTLTLVTRERLKGRGSMAEAPVQSVKSEPPVSMPQAAEKTPLAKIAEPAAAPLPSVAHETTSVTKAAAKANQAFLARAKTQVKMLRELLGVIERTTDPKVRRDKTNDLYLQVHSFTASAEAFQQRALFQLGSALEALLKKLVRKTAELENSTLQTLSAALNLIQKICDGDPEHGQRISEPIGVLAVDDDPIARGYMKNALQLKFLLPQSAADGKTAVELATKQHFDVIFLDVQMPDIDGFMACKQIRETPANRHTPVVFVSSTYNPALQAQANDCYGNDFISKPYICSELTLKTITYAFGNRLTNLDVKSQQELQAANA